MSCISSEVLPLVPGTQGPAQLLSGLHLIRGLIPLVPGTQGPCSYTCQACMKLIVHKPNWFRRDEKNAPRWRCNQLTGVYFQDLAVVAHRTTDPLNLWLSCSIIGRPQVTYKWTTEIWTRKYMFQFVFEVLNDHWQKRWSIAKPDYQLLGHFGCPSQFLVASGTREFRPLSCHVWDNGI
jgi:hypothetical protein